MSFFEKIKAGLKKTKENTAANINAVFATFRTVDEELLSDLEDALILADIGAYTASEAIDELRKQSKLQNLQTKEAVIDCLAKILADKMAPNDGLRLDTKPSVILMVGVNGVGKTTSIGKIGAKLTAQGKKVLFAAADTFRAAAADQLSIWAQRAGADIVRHSEGADPSAVIFDALTAAKARGVDVVICDTAGRLHNKQNLMNELEKMRRVIDRELPGASVETLLVLDATTGQNAISQAEGFNSVTGLTGLVLTKLDGTAKGGIAIHVSSAMKVPVKFIGVGEQADDLLEFNALEFTRAFFDGRKPGEIRPVSIVTDFICYPEGSVLISCGNTKVICNATVEDTVPPFLQGKGRGWVTAEYNMLPRATATRTPRDISKLKLNGRAAEIQRLIGRALRSVVDLEALGERCITVDCDVIQADGGTRCASITGAFCALVLALDKLKKQGVLNCMPLYSYVAAVSVGIVNDEPACDLDYVEDSGGQVDFNFIMDDEGNIIELQGTGEERPFSKKELDDMYLLAQNGIRQLVAAQKQAVGHLFR